ncbi:MAG TPA: hypothetical protein VEJ23_01375 [Solirubrobacteraceae bacterium]|nr:hypothetical protein [Solirubrobacteraceae bacterium]
MPYTTAEGRQQLLDALAEAIAEIGAALSSLGEAYELLDERKADELERTLFGPVQVAYGRARRTHSEFARRHGLPEHAFAPATPGAPSHGARGFVDEAVEAATRADATLATLQDSMLPVEVGDADLRAGLGEVRSQLDGLRDHARELLRTLGR